VGDFTRCVTFTLLPENDGQSLHVTPNDAGGATAYGLTLPTLSVYLNRAATLDDLRQVDPALAALVYRRLFWDTLSGDQLPAGIDLMLFDHGVVAGWGEAAREVQGVVGVTVDGIIGPQTLTAIRARPVLGLIHRLVITQRIRYMSRPTFTEFGTGWLRRLDRRAALAMGMTDAA